MNFPRPLPREHPPRHAATDVRPHRWRDRRRRPRQPDAAVRRSAATEGDKTPRGLPGLPHHTPKAKRVVVFWQEAALHLDLFDDKPVIREMAGKDITDTVRGSTRLSTMSSGYGKWPPRPGDQAAQELRQGRHPR